MAAEVPGWKAAGGELGFAVAGRDQQHQAIDLAGLDALQLLGDLVMDRGWLVARVGVLGEAN